MPDSQPRVGFIGFGEVAATFAPAIEAHGGVVRAYDLAPGKAQARFLPLAELLAQCDWILSTVTTQVAREVARNCQPWLRAGQIYLDLNSTSPKVKREIEQIVAQTPAGFAEGAILGAVGVEGPSVRILTGGPQGRQAADMLAKMGLNARFFSECTGQAAAFKMLRSVFSKGMEALLLEMLTAAQRAGIAEQLWRDVVDFIEKNPFERVAANWIRTHPAACERRYYELRQVCETLRELGLGPLMTLGAEAFFERSRAQQPARAFPEKPESWRAVVEYLAEKVGAGKAGAFSEV